MNPIRAIGRRLRALGKRRAVKSEIDEELLFHLEQRTAENMAAGLSPEEAAREARKHFGNFQTIREECRGLRGANFGETVLQDIRFGARLLRKNPGFTTLVLLTLGVGIGSVSSVFSVVQGVLLKPFPYSKPEKIVLINSVRKDGAPYAAGCTVAEWRGWRTEAKSFEDMAAYSFGASGDFLISPDGNESVSTLDVTLGFFKVMGIQPQMGRAFVASDFPPSGESATVVILGHEFWRRRFHGDSNIIGKLIRFNFSYAGPLTVVGVMPPDIRALPSPFVQSYDINNARIDCWIPVSLEGIRQVNRGVVGRLRDGARLSTAQAELTAISARRDDSIAPQLFTMRLLTAFSFVASALALIGIYGVLSVSVASRRQEMAIRMAVGAPRRNVFGLIFGEGLRLVGVGVIAGAGVALASARILRALLFGVEPTDPLTFVAVAVLFMAVAALACYVPARRATQIDPMEALRFE